MKNIQTRFLIFIGLLVFVNPIIAQQAQRIVKDETQGNSNIYESGDENDALIGIGTSIPSAKLHIQSKATSLSPTIKTDFITNEGSVLASIESWHIDGSINYGIYQPQPLDPNIIVKNYFQNNLGIGVANPKYKLDINGIIGCTGPAATGIKIDNTNQPFVIKYFSSGGSIGLENPDNQGDPIGEEEDTATLSPLTIYSNGVKVQDLLECTSTLTTMNLKIKSNAHIGSVFISNSSSGLGTWTDPSVFSIFDGRVGIGIVNSYTDYKLAVNGKAICEEMKVKLKDNWPDYVFNPDYQLRSLKEVDQYIQTNNHLPEMPSATEVAENGINLGEMNARLVKKVEELTLYLIAIEKEMEQLKAQVAAR